MLLHCWWLLLPAGVRPVGTGVTNGGASSGRLILSLPWCESEIIAQNKSIFEDLHDSVQVRRGQLQALHSCCCWASSCSLTLVEMQSGSSYIHGAILDLQQGEGQLDLTQ